MYIISRFITNLVFIYRLYINTHPRTFTKNQFTIVNLCVALLLGYVTFLAGIDRRNDEVVSCSAAGAFIHYFFLVSFCWEAVEAYLLQTTFLSTLSNVHMHRFRLKTVLFSWGLPLVIVAIVLMADFRNYVGQRLYVFLSTCPLNIDIT